MNLAIIGTKGAGKGTQCARLVDNFNLLYFSPGNLIREAIKKRSELGIIAADFAQRGELVPDDFVNALVEEWLWTTSPKKGIIFDGFPRTTYQAGFLEQTFNEMGRALDAVVYLNVSEVTVVQRLTSRRVCHFCQEEFHLVSAPFKSCPLKKCEGQHLRQLNEDKPIVISTLVSVFRRSIQALLEFYQQKNTLTVVNGDVDVDEVHASILQAVERFR